MSERVAIVVGAGGELGRVTAEKLAAAGFTVAGVDRSEEALKDLPDSIWREAVTATPEDLRLMIDVNLGTALWLTQAVVPYLRDRGRSRPYPEEAA